MAQQSFLLIMKKKYHYKKKIKNIHIITISSQLATRLLIIPLEPFTGSQKPSSLSPYIVWVYIRVCIYKFP